jgi:RimJ/RimL family protein N-acetyltransferase
VPRYARIPDDIETGRLRGELPAQRHVDGWLAMMTHPQLVPTMWPGDLGGARTREQVEEIAARDARHRDEWGLSPWAVVLGGETIGRVGIAPTRLDGEDRVELAWMLHPGHWGHGYVTEVARIAVQAAWDAGVEDLVAFTLPHNARSRAVMDRLGMTYVRDTEHAGLPHVVYELRRPRAPRGDGSHDLHRPVGGA